MFVKKYMVNDMAEAMRKIRVDLGPEALIVSSRQLKDKGLKGVFGKKKIEVLAAYEPKVGGGSNALPKESAYAAKPQPTKYPQRSDVREDKIDRLSEKLEDLACVVQGLSAQRGKEIDLPGARAKKFYERFVEQDMWEDIARDMIGKAQQISRVTSDPYDTILENLLVQQMDQTLSARQQENRQHVILLMGPTGVGKTTTLVKLASSYLIEKGKTVGIINTDTYRVAAQEQLKTYADIMGIPMFTVYKPEEMAAAKKELSDKQVVLVDTAGKSSYDESYRADMRQIIDQSCADEVLLLIAASTGYRCVKETIANYSFAKEYKLIVTKVDEVSTRGGILNIAAIADKPVTYLTTGQNVPDDIEPIDARKIAAGLMGRR